MREILLINGGAALVDDEDYAALAGQRWRRHTPNGPRSPYAIRLAGGRTVYMHREIMGYPAQKIDHVNGDGLDNRRANLRCCTTSENARNAAKHRISPFGRPSGSEFKGIYLSRNGRVWVARISVNGRKLGLGRFTSEKDAARAYDAAAVKHFGEFARLNFPDEHPRSTAA